MGWKLNLPDPNDIFEFEFDEGESIGSGGEAGNHKLDILTSETLNGEVEGGSVRSDQSSQCQTGNRAWSHQGPEANGDTGAG